MCLIFAVVSACCVVYVCVYAPCRVSRQTLEQYVFVYKALLDDLASRIKDSSSNGGSISSSGGRSSGSSLGGGSCSSGGNSSGDNAVRSSGRNAVA